ncbi:hypothetical protein Tco_0340387 [Tanacetum coccineum]
MVRFCVNQTCSSIRIDGYRKDGDGDGKPHKGVKASANSDVKYSFTSAQDGEPLQDDVRLCLGNDLKKAQDHNLETLPIRYKVHSVYRPPERANYTNYGGYAANLTLEEVGILTYPLTKFSYKNNYHASTKVAPFEIPYSR